MYRVLVAGGGKIGMLVATLLAESNDYHVCIADNRIKSIDSLIAGEQASHLKLVNLDITDKAAFQNYLKENPTDTIVSCLPYFCNVSVAQIARENQLNYFDITEDVNVSQQIKALARGATKAFVPQCGLAPGFISIVANDLLQHFNKAKAVLMRVGALPEFPHNELKYALTWSTEGLINEYANVSYAIADGKEVVLQPLEDLETLILDGVTYEAFNTSGGLGSLIETYRDKVDSLNYKTLRYPGHCEKMRFLMHELQLKNDRATLKKILENALPTTQQDVVIINVAVTGYQKEVLVEEAYFKKITPKIIAGKLWSAIQVSTSASVCAVIDLILKAEIHRGFIAQESIRLQDFTENRFGKYYL